MKILIVAPSKKIEDQLKLSLRLREYLRGPYEIVHSPKDIYNAPNSICVLSVMPKEDKWDCIVTYELFSWIGWTYALKTNTPKKWRAWLIPFFRYHNIRPSW